MVGNRILVTGCSGFIGSHMADHLVNNDWQVIGVDKKDSISDRYQFIKFDLQIELTHQIMMDLTCMHYMKHKSENYALLDLMFLIIFYNIACSYLHSIQFPCFLLLKRSLTKTGAGLSIWKIMHYF